jgi:hypothetical protein
MSLLLVNEKEKLDIDELWKWGIKKVKWAEMKGVFEIMVAVAVQVFYI